MTRPDDFDFDFESEARERRTSRRDFWVAAALTCALLALALWGAFGAGK